ncbi:hypothetical protein D3C76_1691100 [compost metagenome]
MQIETFCKPGDPGLLHACRLAVLHPGFGVKPAALFDPQVFAVASGVAGQIALGQQFVFAHAADQLVAADTEVLGGLCKCALHVHLLSHIG